MTSFHRRASLLAGAAVGGLLFAGVAAAQPQADADMKAVLDRLAAMGAKPIHTLAVPEARSQANPADAAKTVQWAKHIPSTPESRIATTDIGISTDAGVLPARVYTPEGKGPFPVIVYFHGGGWVLADLNVYDATPRGLALGTQAIVISVDYRHAPEHKFPAQHEDAWSTYVWTVETAHTLNGDASRIAVAGESAGANLAANVALMAKERKTVLPVHQLLVYPIAGNDMNTASYKENAAAQPLGKADMEWFVRHVFASADQTADPRVNLIGRTDLAGLPPATVILAEIDPLRSEGEAYADAMQRAGVEVTARTFEGVAHEFFGMGKVVADAKQATDLAVSELKAAFAATHKTGATK